MFYSDNSAALRIEVAGFLAAARGEHLPPPRALATPHAGHPYSGPIAGSAWATVTGAPWKRVLLLGPAHRVAFTGCAVAGFSAWATPLGNVTIDSAAEHALIHHRLACLLPDAHAAEHCLEVNLPFLHTVLPKATLIPVLVGDAEPDEVAALIDACDDGATLPVVSTDLSHYLPDPVAKRRDEATLAAVLAGRSTALGSEDACGHLPLAGLMQVAARHGWHARLLDHRTSGDTQGGHGHVVGYAAVAWA
jgi:AmmeMemoRadiSam system protein B